MDVPLVVSPDPAASSAVPAQQPQKRRRPRKAVITTAVAVVVAAVIVATLVLLLPPAPDCTGPASLEQFSRVEAHGMDRPDAWNTASAAAHVINQDGLITVAVSNTSHLYFFSDTLVNCTSLLPAGLCTPGGWDLVSNTAMVVTMEPNASRTMSTAGYVVANGSSPYAGFPVQVVGFSANQTAQHNAIWPVVALPVPRDPRRPVVLWETMQRGSQGGPWSFAHWGSGSGRWDAGSQSVHRVTADAAGHYPPVAAVPSWRLPASMTPRAVGDAWYLYFLVGPADNRDVVVARVPVSMVLDPASAATLDAVPLFWDGTGFSASLPDAQPVIHDVGGPRLSAEWLPAIGRVVIITARPFGNEVHAFDAAAPWGPFGCATTVWRYEAEGDPWIYSVGTVPSLAPPDGRTLVGSFSVFTNGRVVNVLPKLFNVTIS